MNTEQKLHTPEPWRCEYDNSDFSAGGQWYEIKDAAGNNVLWKPYNDNSVPIAANAHRIVACVNACAGLKTESLIALVDDGKTIQSYAAGVEQQRDELLAELNYLNGQFNGEYFCCSVCGHEETTSNMDSAIHLREFLTNFATTTADR